MTLLAADFDMLNQSALFQGVDVTLLTAELEEAGVVYLRAGDVLLDPARPNRSIFVVLSGELNVFLEQRGQSSVTRLASGSCVGELSIIDDKPPSAYVVAGAACRLLAVEREALWRMMNTAQGIALNLLHILAERIRQNNAIILQSIELQRQYRDRAETDLLTGMRNRAWMEDIFPQQIELSGRIGQNVTLLMIDLDLFKEVNDRYGHPVGDQALRLASTIIKNNLRSTDLCSRYGGEEFAALLPATDIHHARIIAERLRVMISSTPLQIANGETVHISASIGVAQWRPETPLAELLSSADQALFQAKTSGRNQVCVQPTWSGGAAP